MSKAFASAKRSNKPEQETSPAAGIFIKFQRFPNLGAHVEDQLSATRPHDYRPQPRVVRQGPYRGVLGGYGPSFAPISVEVKGRHGGAGRSEGIIKGNDGVAAARIRPHEFGIRHVGVLDGVNGHRC